MAKIIDKILSGVLAVVIVVAIGVVIYYNFLESEGEDNGEIVLSVLYGNETWEYTVSDLKDIDDYSGSGGMSTKAGIKGPNDYKGVRFELLLQDIGITNVSSIGAKVIAIDGYNKTFNPDLILGNVTIYDSSGNKTNGTVTLIIAYEQDGIPITTDDGPLRLAFVSEQPLFTSSSNWIKQLATIEVSQAT